MPCHMPLVLSVFVNCKSRRVCEELILAWVCGYYHHVVRENNRP